MDIQHLRLDNNKTSCRGAIYIDTIFYGVTMEDPVRTEKIPKITAIPAGEYEVIFRDEPSTKREQYRAKYDWFHNHLWLQNVPGYQWVYIHIGNYPKNSDGCLLVNNILYSDDNSKEGQSTDAFRKFYLKVKSALDKEENVKIIIKNVFQAVGQEILSE